MLDALAAANAGPALAYGRDRWTDAAVSDLRELFDAPVEVLLCWGGTGANVVGLAPVLQPWQSVICTDTAHIVVDECGAPARFTGATITPVPHDDGKLRTDAVAPYLGWLGVEHHPQPAVLSISQVTEMCTIYTVEEIAELCDLAHRHGLLAHVDGARIANAVAASGTDVVSMLRQPGVDLMTFGLTKNGALYGEAVVFLRPELAVHGRFVRKQAGQLVSQSRSVATQVSALLADDLWLRNARHANEMARSLAQRVSTITGVDLPPGPPTANSLFPSLPAERIAALQDWSFFWPWDPTRSQVRWMTSFATTTDDIDRFALWVEAALGH
ncbi:low specificity L-threonine aldolase [soil metagenome]